MCAPDLSGKLAVLDGRGAQFGFVARVGSRREAPTGDSDVAGTESYDAD